MISYGVKDRKQWGNPGRQQEQFLPSGRKSWEGRVKKNKPNSFKRRVP